MEEIRVMVSTIQLIDTSPTAPTLEDNLPEEYEERTLEQSKTFITNKAEIKTKEITPFTDSQLNSLYNNQELKLVDMFISEFTDIQMRFSVIKQQHKLYELLMSYLRVRNHLTINSHDLENLKKTCKETQKQLWCLDKTSITESGECQDGNPVNATHEYSIAHFSQQILVALSRNLSSIKEKLHSTQALYCYEAEMLKLQIEYYVQKVCMACKEFANIPQNAPVNFIPVQTQLQTIPQLIELRMCITILFNFQRKLLKDWKFVNDSREWLTKLISILLRVASWQDHLFILNHILRCPGGVMNWAQSYVQVPTPLTIDPKINRISLNEPHFDHMVAILAVILLPVKDREVFLEQV